MCGVWHVPKADSVVMMAAYEMEMATGTTVRLTCHPRAVLVVQG